jgi:membrane protein
MTDERPSVTTFAAVRGWIGRTRTRLHLTLVWQVWERMLEIEFVDRSVALAGKAFVSFFPLVIVVAAFMPPSIRSSILGTMTNRLGIRGNALAMAKQAFKSADDIRRAEGVLGLVLTVFFASSFTTALQRVYQRCWRRPAGAKVGAYTRGPAWLVAMLAYMALLGALRALFGDGVGIGFFLVASLVITAGWWTFTAWFLLLGQVRWRVLIPSGIVTGITMGAYALSATIWMPEVITRNETQFGFFGVALALVTWFSGAAICIMIGACVGPVLAEDRGPIGALVRGRGSELLIAGAPPSLPPPDRGLRLRDAFSPTPEDVTTR